MKFGILQFPGSCDDRDALSAARRVGDAELLWHGERDLRGADAIIVPGGFSYGDYLRCGAIAAHSPAMRSVRERAASGVPVLGICNGFQILTEAGLLPGALLRNASLTFVCRNVGLRVESSQSLFTAGYSRGQRLNIPVAHHDGNYFADEATLDRLEERGQIAFRYCDAEGELSPEANPNGSARAIAGIFNETKNVLGLMPHPENAVEELHGSTDGRAMFKGIVEALS